ncbi:hypothetical protein HPB47_004207 [Ixodes persulcatus]|uniref:Uncharacterized protein n=1 Tax=Ixodes persulcatus TaxID=34615 RepID=A0AC60PHH1_IXOPE|nr:hypothetical protein HPB47_004207 [Ixodes persulcatus]
MAKSEEQAMEAFLVTGFSPMLDWRPIQFSKTPRPLICDLCGVLSMRPFFPGSCTHWNDGALLASRQSTGRASVMWRT